MLAWIPIFPLIGFLINGIWYAFFQAPRGKHAAGAGITGTIASVAIFASFAVALASFIHLTGLPPEERMIEQTLYSWMHVGDFNVDIAFRMDALSALFTLLITGVG